MLNMEGRVQIVMDVPNDLSFQLASRDASLWLSTGFENDSRIWDAIIELVRLPWNVVLTESVASRFAREVLDHGASALQVQRGHLMVMVRILRPEISHDERYQSSC